MDDQLDELLDLVAADPVLRDELSITETPAIAEPESASGSGFLPHDSKTKLGRYRIIGIAGEGRYARIYHGYDPVLERDVALKVIHPDLLQSSKVIRGFLEEARRLPGSDIRASFPSSKSAETGASITSSWP